MKKALFLILLAIFISGCANVYNVRVNGYLDSTYNGVSIPAGSTFFVVAQKDAPNKIFENQVKAKIERLLIDRGQRLAPYESAEFLVYFSYKSSSGGSEIGERAVFYPGQTGTIRTYTSNGKSRVSYVDYPGYTTYVPYRYNVYTSSLSLEVVDAQSVRNSAEARNVWIAEASSNSRQMNLREMVNYLLVAVFRYFGQDTHVGIDVNIYADDPQLKQIIYGN